MNERRHDGDFEDFLAGRSDLSDSYRRLGAVEPPAELDARILEEARRAIRPRRSRSWWRTPGLALATVLVLGLSVIVSRQAMWYDAIMLEEDAATPVQGTPVAAPTSKGAPAESEVPLPAAPPGLATQTREVTASGRQQTGGTSETAGAVTARSDMAASAERDTFRQTGEASALSGSQPPEAIEMQKAEERSHLRRAPGGASDQPALRSYSPTDSDISAIPARSADQWLTRIEAMIEQGATDDARKELLRFREAYPDHELPKDLSYLLTDGQQ